MKSVDIPSPKLGEGPATKVAAFAGERVNYRKLNKLK